VNEPLADGTLLGNIVQGTWTDLGGTPFGPVVSEWETLVNNLPYLSMVKSGPGEVRQGDTFTYEIEIRNSGGSTAENVILVDMLPVGLSYVSSNPSGVYDAVTGTISWSLGDMAREATVTVEITVTADFGLPPHVQVTNTARVNWEASGTSLGPVTATADTVINSSLAVTKTADVSRVFPGQNITYSIEYRNLGTTVLSGVVVKETYDQSVTFISAVPPPTSGNDTWEIGFLNPGASSTILVTVQAHWDLPEGTVIRNQVNITSQQIPDLKNEVKTDLDLPPVLAATKSASLYADADNNGTASPGDTLLYTIRIRNNGGVEATGVSFYDTPDQSTTLVPGSISTSKGTVTGGNNGVPPVTVSIGSISAGETVEILFRVIINRWPPADSVSNQGRVTSQELSDVLTDDPDTALEGDPTVTYIHQRPMGVGGEVRAVNQGAVLAPWLVLGGLVLIAGTILIRSGRRTGR